MVLEGAKMKKVKEVFKDKAKLLHIIIIILGIAFISLTNFHKAIWFDESYSVAISAHSFSEIWNIGGHDVHPVLYYWILHILRYIFGNEILVYRLFSVLVISILGILGYTHIRKDFGGKVGSRRPSGLRKTNFIVNSLAHRTTWLRSDFSLLIIESNHLSARVERKSEAKRS